ncbi:protein GVQW3-like [Schistocerca americana]|uniref:protein GVQW3-like n=1 Tax=Schistocerca americana TaxID=7009 RepID=UPI001F500A3E|nr:protein GVQW3-like [Schistocerca americana]
MALSQCLHKAEASRSVFSRSYGEKVRFGVVVKAEVRAVIRYEWARGVSGTESHNRLVEVYWSGLMSKHMVRRWCQQFSDGRQQVQDIPRPGRTRTATTDAHVRKVEDMIKANRRITIDGVAAELGIGHERAHKIIHDILRYRNVPA